MILSALISKAPPRTTAAGFGAVVVDYRTEELSARSWPFSSVGIGKCNKERNPRVVFALGIAVSDRLGTRRTPFLPPRLGVLGGPGCLSYRPKGIAHR